MVPLYLDDVEVANLLIFPSTLQALWRRYKVPFDLQQCNAFVVVVVPWTMKPTNSSHHDIQSSLMNFTSAFERTTSQAIQSLNFPDDLRTYMSLPNRTYCVWWSPGDGTTTSPGLETQLLHRTMKSCGAKNVGHKTDVRVVFVHVGALSTLHKFPALAERRGKRPEIHFYTYGTHPSVPRELWGVRAIYSLGKPFGIYVVCTVV